VRRAVIGLVTGMLVLLLLVDGITTKTVGASSTGAASAADSPLAGRRPILTHGLHGLVSRQRPPGRRIALTFDDGPDPRWTPQIARILLREHVPATFFEVGSQVVRHPQLTRMLVRDGFQIGNHTFTHANLVALPAWERNLQIALDESAIAGVTRTRPRLVRPPYSSTPDAVTSSEDRAWNAVARQGYTIVLSNYDTEDWTQPGVGTIIANGTPRGRQGGLILMHDAGGRRAQTVAALPTLIARLRSRGFSFVRASTLAGIPAAAADVPASNWQHVRGSLLLTMLAAANVITLALTGVVGAVTVLVALRMLAVLLLAGVQVRRTRRLPEDLSFTPTVSILVPAFDEAVGIERAVRSLAASRYPADFEVIVVDDGSSDGTAALVEGLRLERVRVLRQANAGKAAALNGALRVARHDVLVTVDADTVFEPDTLVHLVQRFREPDVGAVSGNTKVGRRHHLVERWQHLEYVMSFNLDRRMYEVLGCTPTVPGAIGAFRREALADIGGVSGATLAEDTDVTLAVGRAGWRVVYEPRARAWTEVPSTLRALYRQRSRWAYGTFQSLWKHRGAVWRSDQARIGRRALPYMTLFQVVLPLAAPLIDLFAVYGLLFLDPVPIAGFWLGFNALQLVLGWFAFGWDGERRRALWALPLQQVVYRQIMYLVVIDAVISALVGTRLSWDRLERTGRIEVAHGEP
jgi:cellulose synthase/poly-beta-1,6-N-acetylglucosamine synthase-like glycosyltransferase/peptidoglycan/xylan/chitin deacetylase (PgdA/CDA1 family)